MKDFRNPTNVKEVREFLGLAGYYRRFVPNFARVAGPLHSLTKQEVPFHWTGECQQSFDCLKRLLSEPPVLVYPDFTRPFTLHTDASGKGLGAVLEQENEGGDQSTSGIQNGTAKSIIHASSFSSFPLIMRN